MCARTATSSRRRPGVRRRAPAGRPSVPRPQALAAAAEKRPELVLVHSSSVHAVRPPIVVQPVPGSRVPGPRTLTAVRSAASPPGQRPPPPPARRCSLRHPRRLLAGHAAAANADRRACTTSSTSPTPRRPARRQGRLHHRRQPRYPGRPRPGSSPGRAPRSCSPPGLWPALDRVVTEVRACGGTADAVTMDLADPASIRAAVGRVDELPSRSSTARLQQRRGQ